MVVKYETEQKLEARKENARLYRDLSKRNTIPATREYWCLCNRQFRRPTSEINQMGDLLGFRKNQFHGVDFDELKIKRNKRLHPEAHFYAGSWEDVIVENDFNPALVYLD